MIAFIVIFFLPHNVNCLKTWIHNTDINNKLNWDVLDTPKNCDNIRFEGENDVATFWNVKDLVLSGWSLPETGDVIFPHNTKIQFRDKEKCSQARDLKYIRTSVKGWLDPDNWKSDSESEWLPHSERVPCAGEAILFPPKQTFAVQLPAIMVPSGEITFDNEAFDGETWSKFLKTDLGYQLFKGPDDIRNLPWRKDIGCLENKKCICSRSSYTIRDGIYKNVAPRNFEEAVCLYAMPKCKPSECYSPVVPEGHCCGVCGAVIKLEDKSEEGLNLDSLKKQVKAEINTHGFNQELKSYIGRTRDENIQIVIVAENSGDTIKSHTIANSLRTKLKGQHFYAISSHVSGLTFSNYLFNSVSGVVFGTLIAVLLFFVGIYYIYMVLPKKKFQRLGAGNPFMFARFDNTLHDAGSEETLEIGAEPETSDQAPQAFDNLLYSENIVPSTSGQSSNANVQSEEDNKNISEKTSRKEYSNPVYKELEKSEKLDLLQSDSKDPELEEFSEIKL